MPVSTVWKHAFEKLGATPETADKMLDMLRSMASSPQAFREWDQRLPAAAERPLIAAIDAPGGEKVASEILTDFQQQIMRRHSISPAEVAAKLKGIGFN